MTLAGLVGRVYLVACLALTACDRSPRPAPPTNGVPPRPIAQGVSPERLVLGLTPFVTEPKLRREFLPLAQYLGSRLGIPAELKRAESYADISRMFAAEEVNFAVLSPFAYVQAKQAIPGLVLLATQIADGSSTYSGYLLARDEAGVERLSDLRGRRFAFIDRNSASGYLYPLAYMRALGLVPERFFSSITFAGNHERAIAQLLAREVDVAAVASPVLRMISEERGEASRLKIIAKTGRVPFDAYCAHPKLAPAVIEKMRAALLDLNTRNEDGRRILAGLASINGFVAVGDDHYDEVRRVAQIVAEGASGSP